MVTEDLLRDPCIAGGGYGANRNNPHGWRRGGNGSGGNINVYGGGGQPRLTRSSPGGPSYWGGNTAAGHPGGGQFTYNPETLLGAVAEVADTFHGNRGAQGRQGCVVVYEYY